MIWTKDDGCDGAVAIRIDLGAAKDGADMVTLETEDADAIVYGDRDLGLEIGSIDSDMGVVGHISAEAKDLGGFRSMQTELHQHMA